MKKTLIIRWSIIAVVILVWIWAMFPIKDKDYMSVFDKKTAKNVAKLTTKAETFVQANGDPTEVIRSINAIDDRKSKEYEELSAKLSDFRSKPDFDSWMKYFNYQELQKRLNLIALKAKYENAEFIKGEMESLPDKASMEYKSYEQLYNDIVNAEGYKKWTESSEYAEMLKRIPAGKMKEQLDAFQDKTSDEYKKLFAQYKELDNALSEIPAFDSLDKKADYIETINRLSLVYDVEKNISGFKALEKAANGNSKLYRITLNDYVKIPFFGVASNKSILRYIRTRAASKLHLGLDLQGGTEFVLDFDINEAKGLMVTDKTMQNFIIDYLADTEKFASEITPELATLIKNFADSNAELEKNDMARSMLKQDAISIPLRNFLSANTHLLRKQTTDNYASVTDIRDRILNIMDNRLNSMGVTEPEIKASGENTISVTMPSVDEADKNEIRNTIRRAAKLEFYLVVDNNNELVSEYEADPQGFRTPAGVIRSEIENESANGSVTYTTVFLEEEPTPVKGEDIERAFATTDEYGRFMISLKFNSDGTVAFREVTSQNIGRLLAIVLDGKVYSAPRLKTEIGNGQAVIEGNFTLEEAKRLASVIASGNVPVTVNIGSEFGTDPTLGRDSVSKGIVAGIIGLAIVVLFMLAYYRLAGIIAVCALVVNTILTLGSMSIFSATITLPGIAGMVLTIGMAVDANVIIFERIREELLAKASITNAIKAGYAKAFSSIFDSNLTTLLTCLFLFKFGEGSVKGFAVTLSFGILASMFTAIFMTRTIFMTLIAIDAIKSLNMCYIKAIHNTKIDFIGIRKITVGISCALVIISLLTFAIKGHKMMGIDFTGGTQLAYECQGEAPNVENIREFLKGEGYVDNVRVGYKRGQSGERLLEIVFPSVKENGVEKKIDYTDFNERLDKKFPEVKISLKQTNVVGANVGSKFRSAAFVAGLFSVAAIIIYLAFRFEFMYGVAATIAIVHDAIISTGIFVLCGGNISLTVVAAIMTIMGYSINDTIVIFDRVRETKAIERKLTYAEIINKSINECMSRTIITSVTTFFAVFIMLVLGGGAIFDFALVMTCGVLVGTYSSMCIAPVIISIWHKRSIRDAKIEAANRTKNTLVAPSQIK